MDSESSLLLHLHKLSPISEAALEQVLKTLWNTRKTGLIKPQDKSCIQSLLNLNSTPQLDLLVACLRLVVRKCVHPTTTDDDFFKPPHLQNLLLKYQTAWKEEASKDQRSNISTVQNSPSTPFPDWPRQHHNKEPVFLHQLEAPHNLPILPRVKSMTWTMQNHKSNRLSIITLKLHDYTKSPSGEREVKFQLTKDTLEAMLRSMTYISKQLSNNGGASSGPLQKKPRA
ncbi:hypothetical protein IFM89_016614 [Coptis chinensis]|uniref:COMM domain-containing protein n=1 Tax=Coptis chinensis TaxID=261450 RepID=A0A835INN8_9MAGN|nr:hypothetical protein IFM89_016614 [Coptis chinensis]